MQPHEFLKLTKMNNCGECGYAACLAFAASVTKGGEDPSKCPYVDQAQLGEAFGTQGRGTDGLEGVAKTLDKKDLALVAHLKSKIESINIEEVAVSTGCDWNSAEPTLMRFTYLGRQVQLSTDGILINGKEPKDPRDQILLYNYIYFGGGEEPAPDWIGMESMPNSISKIRTLNRYCEDRIAEHFSGRADHLVECGVTIGGKEVTETEQNCSVAFYFQVLPRLPIFMLFWDEEKEEGFPAKVKVLFDCHVLDMLDLESLVFTAERTAEHLIEISNQMSSNNKSTD